MDPEKEAESFVSRIEVTLAVALVIMLGLAVWSAYRGRHKSAPALKPTTWALRFKDGHTFPIKNVVNSTTVTLGDPTPGTILLGSPVDVDIDVDLFDDANFVTKPVQDCDVAGPACVGVKAVTDDGCSSDGQTTWCWHCENGKNCVAREAVRTVGGAITVTTTGTTGSIVTPSNAGNKIFNVGEETVGDYGVWKHVESSYIQKLRSVCKRRHLWFEISCNPVGNDFLAFVAPTPLDRMNNTIEEGGRGFTIMHGDTQEHSAQMMLLYLEDNSEMQIQPWHKPAPQPHRECPPPITGSPDGGE